MELLTGNTPGLHKGIPKAEIKNTPRPSDRRTSHYHNWLRRKTIPIKKIFPGETLHPQCWSLSNQLIQTECCWTNTQHNAAGISLSQVPALPVKKVTTRQNMGSNTRCVNILFGGKCKTKDKKIKSDTVKNRATQLSMRWKEAAHLQTYWTVLPGDVFNTLCKWKRRRKSYSAA